MGAFRLGASIFSEIEQFQSAVLKHHHPEVINLGDMTKFKEWPDAAIDVLVGGTPCQSFSIAGLRKGLDDPRGDLMLTYGALAAKYSPEWLVWENVPGVLSSNGGRDFGTLLGMLGQLGYGFAYRVLDAQYFGLAQRRKRVFVVACRGSWQRAAAVLFERHCLQGHIAPSREAEKGIAPSTEVGTGTDQQREQITTCRMVAFGEYSDDGTASSMKHRDYKDATDLIIEPATYGLPGNWIGRKPENGGNAVEPMNNVSPCLTKTDRHAFASIKSQQVRRLTPVECERLQGFPDNYTNITYNGKPAPDGLRYKALGNSMAVPVMAWIGKRIQMVSEIA